MSEMNNKTQIPGPTLQLQLKPHTTTTTTATIHVVEMQLSKQKPGNLASSLVIKYLPHTTTTTTSSLATFIESQAFVKTKQKRKKCRGRPVQIVEMLLCGVIIIMQIFLGFDGALCS
jgi:hypothetical protein